MTRKIGTLSALASALALSACAGATGPGTGTRVVDTYYDYSFAGSELGYMEQFGPVPVYVRSGPPLSPADVQAIVGAMNGATYTGRLRFVPASAPSAPGYSVTLVMGAPSAPPAAYCPGRTDSPPPAASAQVTGVFCLGARLRSNGTVADRGPAAIASLAGGLFSPDLDPSRRGRPRAGE